MKYKIKQSKQDELWNQMKQTANSLCNDSSKREKKAQEKAALSATTSSATTSNASTYVA